MQLVITKHSIIFPEQTIELFEKLLEKQKEQFESLKKEK